MAAIMDAADGRPVTTIDAARAAKHFGCGLHELPPTPSRTIAIRAGGRAGKTSRIAATAALHAAWTVPVPLLARGEVAFCVLVTPTLKLARQALSFIRGYVEESKALSKAKTGDDADHVSLRRTDGTEVRVEVFAAGRGGTQLRGKTLVAAVMDECAFLRDESTGVVNDTELYRAVMQRIVPGGRCLLASTPWVAGVGLLEELIARNWGTHEHALCCLAPTRDLNDKWDPTGEIEADLRAQDPDAAEREIDAVPLVAGSQHFFAFEAVKAAVNRDRPQKLPKRADAAYCSGGDCAFKRNSSALAIVERRDDRHRLAVLEELKPERGAPLKPSGVVDHFAGVMAEYGDTTLVADSHERDEVALELARHSMRAVNAPTKEEAYIAARKLLHEGKVELPDHPRLVKQLKDVMAKPRPGGGLTITSPRSADGSHGDLVSALVLALWRSSVEAEQRPAPAPPPPPPDESRWAGHGAGRGF